MRDLGEDGLARQWKVGLRREETIIGQLRIVLPGDAGIAEDGEMGAAMAEDGAYALTPANFEDGRFVAWLEREIGKNGAANGE